MRISARPFKEKAGAYMLSGSYFIYGSTVDDIFLSEKEGIQFLNLETTENKDTGGSFNFTTFRSNGSPQHSIQNINYDSTFEIEIEMISENRLDIGLIDGIPSLDYISGKLLNHQEYKPLIVYSHPHSIYDTSDTASIVDELRRKYGYYMCIFTNPTYITAIGGDGYGVYGIKATMKCDSVFRWMDKSVTYTNSQLLDTVVLYNETYCNNCTYCILTINVGNMGGDIIVQNISDNNRLTSIKNTMPNDVITIRCFPHEIQSYLCPDRQLIYDSFNKNFFRLIKGANKLGIDGDISSISIQWQEGRLVK